MFWKWDAETQVRSFELPNRQGKLTIEEKEVDSQKAWYCYHDGVYVDSRFDLLLVMNNAEEYAKKFGVVL